MVNPQSFLYRSFLTITSNLGVTHIAHIASPVTISQDDVELRVLQPAIAGTTSILRSAAKSSTVKRVVVTSSFVAICDIAQGWRPGYTYSEV